VLAVVVRGGDGLIYSLMCADAQNGCDASASQPNWIPLPLPPSPSGIFVGKPAALWPLDNTGLTVAAVTDDRAVMLITHVDSAADGASWDRAVNISNDLAPDDPDPGVAIAMLNVAGDVFFYARNQQRMLVSDSLSTTFFSIGGVLASPPSVATLIHNGIRVEVAAIIDDHGHPGVWWRYNESVDLFPCTYNRPGTCLECGL